MSKFDSERKTWIARRGRVYGPYRSSTIERFLREEILVDADWIWNFRTDQWDKVAYSNDFGHGSRIPTLLERKNRQHILDQTKENQMNQKISSIMDDIPDYDLILEGGGKKGFGTSAIYPVVCKDIGVDDHAFGRAVENLEIEENVGIVCEAPEKKMKRGALDRWLLKEPRALFRRDKDEINEAQANKSPRVSWIKWQSDVWKTPDGVSFNACRVGLLNTENKTLKLFSKGMTVSAFGLISKMGVMVMVVKLEPGKSGISLGDAMELNYHVAHSGNHRDIPVLVPNKAMDESMKENESGLYEVSDEKVSSFLKIWPHWEKKGKEEFDDVIRWGKKNDLKHIQLQSFPEMLIQEVLSSLSEIYGEEIDCYQAARGRTHMYTRFLLPEYLNEEADRSFEKLEGLCARCMRHPKSSKIIPLAMENIRGKEFESFHVTGSQRVHLSCETALSIGWASTDFSMQWQDRWDDDYLLCHLIAYHQAILCQELSWSSFSKTNQKEEEKRNLDELNERYIEFCTHYDFSIISNQLNHQRTYRISREVLGVCQSSKEVAEEIQTRIEHQRNLKQEKFNEKQEQFNSLQEKFNEKQTQFNSLAVLFFLLGCSTFLINMNLGVFTDDATINWDFKDESGEFDLKSLWFWIPVGFSLFLFCFKAVRIHLKQVCSLLFKTDPKAK